MRTASVILTTALVLSSISVRGAVPGDIYLSETTGITTEGGIYNNASQPATFTFSYRNNDPGKANTPNGYEISGSGGISWTATYGAHEAFPVENFDAGVFFNEYSWDGTGADTIGITFYYLFGPGLPPGFDGPAVVLTIDAFGATEGEQICIDSAFYPPAGAWLWAHAGGGGLASPSWDGPHCYDVVPYTGCCQNRGDIDHSGGTSIHVQDLVHLVDYMFQDGAPPPCMEEADVDGSGGSVDIADLVYLVAYMFQSGPVPVPCI